MEPLVPIDPIGAFTVISTRLNSLLNSVSQLKPVMPELRKLVSTQELRVAPPEAQRVFNSLLNSILNSALPCHASGAYVASPRDKKNKFPILTTACHAREKEG